MDGKRVEEALRQWGIRTRLRHTQTLTSAVTTAWGVQWDEAFIARDLMQNVFDGNRACLDAVLVTTQGADVAVTAPTPFNLERLFYLGSEKGEGDVGQYGEGFKAAAINLLRDHGVTPITASGREVVCLRVAEQAVADTKLYPVKYDFYQSDHEVPGALLILQGCSGKLATAVSQGLSHFFYETNPLLGPKRWSINGGAFAIYDSTDSKGHIFYRKLKRGEIEGVPLVLVIDKSYKALEQKISKDRDRNAFGEEVMKLFYSHFARYGLQSASTGQRIIVEAAKPHWERGNLLLSVIASYNSAWSATMAQAVFGDNYYARSSRSADVAEQLEIERLERGWHEEGKVALPGYFRQFGVRNVPDEMRGQRARALEEERKRNRRAPTTAELESIRLLSQVLRELAPEVIAVFDKGSTTYTVAKSDTVLGALRSGRGYRSREVFLAEQVFTADFPEALAVFLHEHSHIFGYDGSRGFTDALTALLETVVRHRHDLDDYDKEWKRAREAVCCERQAGRSDSEAEDIATWLATLDEAALRQLLGGMPQVWLRKLRR